MIRLAYTFMCFVVYIVLLTHAADEDKYMTKYDNIDVDAILANSRLRNQYVNCLLNIFPCVTDVSRFLKEIIGEAYFTRCKKCSDKQMIILDKITTWFTENEPDTFNRLVDISLKERKSSQSKNK